MASAEPIIVVLGPWCGGTSAVAGVLHHLGVLMGAEFRWAYRGPHETWEDSQPKSSYAYGPSPNLALSCKWMLVLLRRNFAFGQTIIAVPPALRAVGLASSTHSSALRWITSVTPAARLCR